MSSQLSDISEQNLKIAKKLESSFKPVLEQQQWISKLASQYSQSVPNIELSNVAQDVAKQVASYRLDTPWLPELLNSVDCTFMTKMESFIKNMTPMWSSSIANAVSSPLIEWLNSFDVSPFLKIFENFKIDYESPKNFNRAYLQAMYECYWFPYAGILASKSLFWDVNEILSSSRGKSKRRTTRIDKAILDYYSDAEIKKIKQRWNKTDLKPYIKKMLIQAIRAHLRGEYVLTISCLATMWEGLLKEKMPQKKRSNSELKEEIKVLVDENGYDCILGDFYNNVILQTCYGVENVLDGVPNRHSVAHSWYKKYPNKKASLNAILLTDFIINLTPSL